jgi:hypothetical protein
MKAFILLLLIVTASLWLTGCASTESRSQKLTLGMSQADATKLMGSDYSTVAARVGADGAPESVLKYDLKRKEPLYLYFRQDKLVQWGDISVLNAMPAAGKPN